MSAIFSFEKGATKKTQIFHIFKRLFLKIFHIFKSLVFVAHFLRLLTGKKHPKIKLQRLRKIRILAFGSLTHQINTF